MLATLAKRPAYVTEKEVKTAEVRLLGEPSVADLDSTEEVVLTAALLQKAAEGSVKLSSLDVSSPAPVLAMGREHPMTTFLRQVRETLLGMGFEEVDGPLVQSSFWTFDALFTPQDHPAREMQDTFYLEGVRSKVGNPSLVRRVKSVHEDGWNLGSKGWRYRWSLAEAERSVMRTHTTAITIRYLAENSRQSAKVFSLGKVFRNESANSTHLMEFNQIEGIVVEEAASVRLLMGYLSAFLKGLGFEKVTFQPSFFPYTEPSLEPQVYSDKLGKWLELGGSGVFRPEVTVPAGVKNPVLAWGFGLERLAMLVLRRGGHARLLCQPAVVVEGGAAMPVITLYKDRMLTLVGGGTSFENVVERLPQLGLHIEEIAGGSVRVEYDPNRLDYSTDYGIARSLRGSFGIARGAPRHKLQASSVIFDVDPAVKEVRPYIAGLLSKGMELDDETIRQIISMQEDLHNGLGRRRAKLAIGIHDADVVQPPIRYSTVPSTFSFTPLDCDSPMTIRQILSTLPTGKKYSSLVSGHDAYPIITDAKGTVLSFPPIINGNATKVTPKTKNLLIDVTGTDRRVLEDCLALLSETFWDAGAQVFSIRLKEGKRTTRTPSLQPFSFSITSKAISDRLGMPVKDSEIVTALKKSRLDAIAKGGRIHVTAPRYRFDLLHPVDLAEETMYGYGFGRLEPSYAFRYTKGSLSPRTHLMEAVRRSATGLGLQEVMGYSLTSREVLFDKMGRSTGRGLKVAASKSSLYEYLRDMLTPTLLQLLADNLHEQYPQRIFEMAEVFTQDSGSESGVKEDLHLGGAITDNTASFTDAKSVLDTTLLKTFNVTPQYEPLRDSLFIQGRGAACFYNGKKLGFVGEVSPGVVLAFGLRTPVSVFEISLAPFFERLNGERV